jgi:hypothetical protein
MEIKVEGSWIEFSWSWEEEEERLWVAAGSEVPRLSDCKRDSVNVDENISELGC